MYIGEYGITYKRIGVYVYLLLSLIGLITTFIKINKVKSNYYLFRTNAWLFYATLILSCAFNWDKIITDYNMQSTRVLDKDYLLGLSNTNLPDLFTIQADSSVKNQATETSRDSSQQAIDASAEAYQNNCFDRTLSFRLYNFLIDHQSADWRSWQYDDSRVYEGLLAMNQTKKIQRVNLSREGTGRFEHKEGINSLKPLRDFNSIQELVLCSNEVYNMSEFYYFTSLRHLDVSKNKISVLKGIEKLNKLEYLNLTENPIITYAPLYSLKQLKELHVNASIPDYELDLLKKNLPNTNILKGGII